MTESRNNDQCPTIEELLDFTAISKLDERSMELIKRINAHVCKCNDCLKQLRAVQTIESAFGSLYESAQAEKAAEPLPESHKPDC